MYVKIIVGLFVAIALTVALVEPCGGALPRNDVPLDMRLDAPRVCVAHVPFDPQLPLM